MIESLKDGAYVLVRAVKNPKPDRRRPRNIRHVVEWKKGFRFIYQCDSGETRGFLRATGNYRDHIGPWMEQFKVLVPHLKPVEMTNSEWIDFEYIGRDTMIKLLDRGVVTRDAIKKARGF